MNFNKKSGIGAAKLNSKTFQIWIRGKVNGKLNLISISSMSHYFCQNEAMREFEASRMKKTFLELKIFLCQYQPSVHLHLT